MGVEPQLARCGRRIDLELAPPCGFIPAAMDFAMVSATQRDGELVADLASKRPALRKAEMMSVTRHSPADEAGLLNALGIGCRQLVFFRKAPMRPDCRIIGGAECVEFGEQAFA